MTVWRRSATALLAVAVTATALAGCTDKGPREVVAGGGGGAGATSAPSQGTPVSGAIVGGPLVAADLPGWADAATPGDVDPSLVSVCGTALDTADLQASAEVAAVTTPVGIEVITKVAKYDADKLAAVISQVDSVLGSCSWVDEGATSTTISPLRTATSGKATGAVFVTTGNDGGTASTNTVYMLAITADGVVEVRTRVHLDRTQLTWSLEDFTGQVLAAAQRKALGSPVGTVRSPEIVASEGGAAGAFVDSSDPNSPAGQWGTSSGGAGGSGSGDSGSGGSSDGGSGGGSDSSSGGGAGAPSLEQLPGEGGVESFFGAPPAGEE